MLIIEIVLALVLGVVVGALVNALGDFLPIQRALALMASGDAIYVDPENTADDIPEDANLIPIPDKLELYPHYADGERRHGLAWSGLLAFITGQRTSAKGAKLSWRHPIIEVVMAMGFVWHVAVYPLDLQVLFYAVFFSILVLVTIIDIEWRLILRVVIAPACIVAIIAAAITPETAPSLKDALIGGVVGYGVYYVIYLGGRIFNKATGTSETAFGFGDVMLGALSGLILGWMPFIVGFVVTVLLGAVGAFVFLLFRALIARRYQMFSAIPYGPYIVIGTLIMMHWGVQVAEILFGLRQ